MQNLKLDQQTIAALVFAGVLLIGGVLILTFTGDDDDDGDATDTPAAQVEDATPDTDTATPVDEATEEPDAPTDVTDDPATEEPSPDATEAQDDPTSTSTPVHTDEPTATITPTPTAVDFVEAIDLVEVAEDIDTDGDGVPNIDDACLTRGDTYGFGVDAVGCPVVEYSIGALNARCIPEDLTPRLTFTNTAPVATTFEVTFDTGDATQTVTATGNGGLADVAAPPGSAGMAMVSVAATGEALGTLSFDCTPPALTVATSCTDAGAQFTLNAAAGSASADVARTVITYTVTDDAGNTVQQAVPLRIGAGDSRAIGPFSYATTASDRAITLTYEDAPGSTASIDAGPCIVPSAIINDVVCDPVRAVPQLAVRNTGPVMTDFLVTYNYVDEDPFPVTAAVAPGDTQTFAATVPGAGTLTVLVGDSELATQDFDCSPTNVVVRESSCTPDASGVTFTLEGTGGATSFRSVLQVVTTDGVPVLRRNVTLAEGESQTFTANFNRPPGEDDRRLRGVWDSAPGLSSEILFDACTEVQRVVDVVTECSAEGTAFYLLDRSGQGDQYDWRIDTGADRIVTGNVAASDDPETRRFMGRTNADAGTLAVSFDGETLYREAFICETPEVTLAAATCAGTTAAVFTLTSGEGGRGLPVTVIVEEQVNGASTGVLYRETRTMPGNATWVIGDDDFETTSFRAEAAQTGRELLLTYTTDDRGNTATASVGPCFSAQLTASTTCNAQGGVNLTVSNPTDVDLNFGYSLASVEDNDVDAVAVLTTLPAITTRTYYIPRGEGQLRLTLGDETVQELTVDCVPPTVTVGEATCSADNSAAAVTLSATGGTTAVETLVTARDEDGVLIDTAPVVLAAGETVELSAVLNTTFTSTDADRRVLLRFENASGDTQDAEVGPCLPLEVTATAACDVAATNTVTLVIDANRLPDTDLSYTITYDGDADSESGPVELNDALLGTVNATATAQAGTFTVSSVEDTLASGAFDCTPPEVSATAVCADGDSVRFTLDTPQRTAEVAFVSQVRVLSTATNEVLQETTAELGAAPFALTVDFQEGVDSPARNLLLEYETAPGETATVVAGPCLSPLAISTAQCAGDGAAAAVNFAVQNTGDDNVEGFYRITNERGTILADDVAFSLGGGNTQELEPIAFSADNNERAITLLVFTAADEGAIASAVVGPCAPPQPAVRIEPTCATEDGAALVRFTISADDLQTTNARLDGDFRVLDADGNVVNEGSVVLLDGESATVDAFFDTGNTNPERRLTLVFNDGLGNTTTSDAIGPCGQPALSATQRCESGAAQLSLFNSGDLDFNGTATLDFADGETLERPFFVPVNTRAALDVGMAVGGTLTLEALAGEVPFTLDFTNCGPPTVAATCGADGFPTLSIANPRTEALTGVDYLVMSDTWDGPQLVNIGNLAAGETVTVSSAQYGEGAVLVRYQDDLVGAAVPAEINALYDCVGDPTITLNSTCNTTTGVLTFTATVRDGLFDATLPYILRINNADFPGELDFSTGTAQHIDVTALPDGSPVTVVLDEGGDFETRLTQRDGCAQSLALNADAFCMGNNSPQVTLFNAANVDTVPLGYSIAWNDGSITEGSQPIAARQTLILDELPGNRGAGTLEVAGLDAPLQIPDCSPPRFRINNTCNGVEGITFSVDHEAFGIEPTLRVVIRDEADNTFASTLLEGSTSGTVTLSASFSSGADNDNRRLVLYIESVDGDTNYLAATAGPCILAPDLALEAVCDPLTSLVAFTLTNNGGPLEDPLPWRNSQGRTGDTDVLPAGGAQIFTVPGPPSGAAVSLTIDEGGRFETTATLEQGCVEQYALDVTATCDDYNQPLVTLTNLRALDTPQLDWTLDFTDGAEVGGSIAVPGNETVSVENLPGSGAGTFSIDGTGYSVMVPACGQPDLSLTGRCAGTTGIVFTITNSGDAMLGAGNWRVTTPVGTEVATGDYQLVGGASETFTVPFAAGFVDPRFLTVSVFNDFDGERLEFVSSSCLPPAQLVIDPVCNDAAGQITFTVSNVGGPLAEGLPFTITSADNLLLSGQTDALSATATQTVSVLAPPDGAPVRMRINGPGGDVLAIEGCLGTSPVRLHGYCNADGSGTFSIFNGGPDMEIADTDLSYAVNDENGVLLDRGTLTMAADATRFLFYEFGENTLTLSSSAGDVRARLRVGPCVVPAAE